MRTSQPVLFRLVRWSLRSWGYVAGFFAALVVVAALSSLVLAARYGTDDKAMQARIESWKGGEAVPFFAAAALIEAGAIISWKRHRQARPTRGRRRGAARLPAVTGPVGVAGFCVERGGGLPLGTHTEHGLVVSRGEHAVLVLGPPRSGKTVSIVIPAVVTAPGPVLVTSTKPEVMQLCAATVRARGGRCWLYDPTGTEHPATGVELVS